MPTLLTNPKMDPALVARIEASLARRSGHAGREIYRPKWIALARVLGVLAIAFTVYQVYRSQKAVRDRFEARRNALLEAAGKHQLTPAEREVLPRVESAVKRLAASYEGDLIAPELALDAVLAKPMIYVSGLVNDFSGDRPVAVGASESTKDAFLYCMFAPPTARDDKTLHAKVLEWRALPGLDERTPNVSLLRDAEAGVPLLLPKWLDQVKKASSGIELGQLEGAFAKSPAEKAKRAAGARFLLAAFDEGIGAAAFEGDRAHDTRVLLFDLSLDKPLLRLRKHVDPSFIPEARRRKYSVEMDQCAIAFDVRATTALR